MLKSFLSYLSEQVNNHSIYVWGGQGERNVTEAWIRKRETSEANARRAIALLRKRQAEGYGGVLRAFDCSGLGVYWLLTRGFLKQDTTAHGLMRMCAPILRGEVKAGDFCFRVKNGSAYHIGYALDAKNTIEAKGRDYGVVRSTVSGDYWNAFGRPPFWKGEAVLPVPEESAGEWTLARLLRLRKPYTRGDDVQSAQKALIAAGYSCGSTGADGIFGGGTQRAVLRFQKARSLAADGIIGARTCAALGGNWQG